MTLGAAIAMGRVDADTMGLGLGLGCEGALELARGGVDDLVGEAIERFGCEH